MKENDFVNVSKNVEIWPVWSVSKFDMKSDPGVIDTDFDIILGTSNCFPQRVIAVLHIVSQF